MCEGLQLFYWSLLHEFTAVNPKTLMSCFCMIKIKWKSFTCCSYLKKTDRCYVVIFYNVLVSRSRCWCTAKYASLKINFKIISASVLNCLVLCCHVSRVLPVCTHYYKTKLCRCVQGHWKGELRLLYETVCDVLAL